jgi:hypothetical protein
MRWSAMGSSPANELYRCARPRPKQNFVAVGTNDGQIAMYQLNFTTVHGLYQVFCYTATYSTRPPQQHYCTFTCVNQFRGYKSAKLRPTSSQHKLPQSSR